ncbi:HCL680Wp [Eremothecium sinecaudum]|uniref:HCL680Wp n=1 Tax=Eremothecium sinecaudum TaxID=45286 RepID=A0A120K1L5_9SACH|nr:HCL680Wp [Eremothecium sinecaudum]AMD19471.1 HCL680Wp [Eremothecium sinecaudum]
MSKVSKASKVPRPKSRNTKTKKSEKKKVKYRVEQLNRQNLSISDLSSIPKLKKPSALEATTLAKRHEEDTEKNQRLQDKSKEVDNDMVKQLEMISGFSL